MIDKFFNRYPTGKFGKSTYMIAVVMGNDQMIDLLNTRVLGSRHDSSGITGSAIAPVSGINEHRFARWSDEEYGVPAFDVDYVYVQRFGSLSLTYCQKRGKQYSEQ
jgi:hypothetical protein